MQLEIPYHPLNRNEKLKQSSPQTVSESLLEELQSLKERIDKQKDDGYIVAVVHLSWDLTNTAHISLMNTIRKRVEELWKPCKIVVGVESDERTAVRKNKKNVFDQDERKYIFENMKSIDKAYIEFEYIDEQTNDKRPCWIIQYLEPNIMISHREHIPHEEEQQVQERLQAIGSDLMVIEFDDNEKYWEQNYRFTHDRSTTNTIKQILKLYKDHPKYQ